MAGLMDTLVSSLFGEGFDFGKEGIMGMLGSEGFKNLLAGGKSLYDANQTGNMLDFQKGLATKADARTEKLFQRDEQEQEALNNLNFG